jgi:Ca2+/Na+ antiporter
MAVQCTQNKQIKSLIDTIASIRVLVQSTTYLASASALSDCIAGGFLAAAAAAIVA